MRKERGRNWPFDRNSLGRSEKSIEWTIPPESQFAQNALWPPETTQLAHFEQKPTKSIWIKSRDLTTASLRTTASTSLIRLSPPPPPPANLALRTPNCHHHHHDKALHMGRSETWSEQLWVGKRCPRHDTYVEAPRNSHSTWFLERWDFSFLFERKVIFHVFLDNDTHDRTERAEVGTYQPMRERLKERKIESKKGRKKERKK